jgi:endonuclease/exonuclease/phosphatase family metal-dependent hydrolase
MRPIDNAEICDTAIFRNAVMNRQAYRPSVGFRLLVFLVAILPGLGCRSNGLDRPATADDPVLRVMTYNLRFASATGLNSWPERRPLMRECIQEASPDVIGTQEGLYAQLKDLAVDLPEYNWIGLGRDGGSRGEFMAIFYRKERLDPIAFDHFWLSGTPNIIGSSTWGNSNRRMVTWVRFIDRRTSKEFYLFNTHFDHQIQTAREKGAELVRERVAALNTPLPVLLTGDFNAGADNKAHQILVSDGFFVDTWDRAKERLGEGLGTFNGFKEVPTNNTRIDWILARGDVEVDREEIVTFSSNGRFPSDHCPLLGTLRFTD